jgi:8-oxo-dGTP diphosphatase
MLREDCVKMEQRKITDVVAALIWEGDRFLICQRPAHKARGLLWEFVGGKVDPGETKAQALVRECREELDITVSVGDVFMEVVHEYPDLLVRLTLFHATIAQGTPQMLEHNDIRWIRVGEIPEFDFCPADVDILKKLMEEKGND